MDVPHPRLLIFATSLICSAGMGLPVSGFPNLQACVYLSFSFVRIPLTTNKILALFFLLQDLARRRCWSTLPYTRRFLQERCSRLHNRTHSPLPLFLTERKLTRSCTGYYRRRYSRLRYHAPSRPIEEINIFLLFP